MTGISHIEFLVMYLIPTHLFGWAHCAKIRLREEDLSIGFYWLSICISVLILFPLLRYMLVGSANKIKRTCVSEIRFIGVIIPLSVMLGLNL